MSAPSGPGSRLALLLAGILISTGASSAATGEEPCAGACRERTASCHADVNDARDECLREAGCQAVRERFRARCLSGRRDEEACGVLRSDLRTCIEICRDVHRREAEMCRSLAATCLRDECGATATDRGESR